MKYNSFISKNACFKGFLAIILGVSFLLAHVGVSLASNNLAKNSNKETQQEVIKASSQHEAVIPAINFDFQQVFVFAFKQIYFLEVKHFSIYLKAGDFIINSCLESLFPTLISPQAP